MSLCLSDSSAAWKVKRRTDRFPYRWMDETEALVAPRSRHVEPEKAARHCRGRDFVAEANAVGQAGDELQRPLEHVRQKNNAGGSARDFRHDPRQLGVAQVGTDDGIPLAG